MSPLVIRFWSLNLSDKIYFVLKTVFFSDISLCSNLIIFFQSTSWYSSWGTCNWLRKCRPGKIHFLSLTARGINLLGCLDLYYFATLWSIFYGTWYWFVLIYFLILLIRTRVHIIPFLIPNGMGVNWKYIYGYERTVYMSLWTLTSFCVRLLRFRNVYCIWSVKRCKY